MGNLRIDKKTQRRFKAFVIDDSEVHADTLYKDLCEQPEFEEIRIYHSCSEAALPLLEFQPDVIFLDIEMPGCSGFDFLESVRSKINFPIKIIFYSAFSKYVLDALRHAAFDFLLKPYKTAELKKIIDRLVEESFSEKNDLLQHHQPLTRKLAIQTVSHILLLTIEEVLYLQYNRSIRSWVLTLTNGNAHRLHQNTTSDDILALHPSLARVNQGDIVNLTYLTAIENNTQRCRFCSPFEEVEIYASRRNFAKLKEKFEFI